MEFLIFIASVLGILAPTHATIADEIQTQETKEEIVLTEAQVIDRVFGKGHIMASVATCESQMHQFKPDGTILRGRVNNKDVGVLQINEDYHLKTSRELGFDIYTLEGNVAYGKYLYEKNGVRDWLASSDCWTKK